MTIQKYNVLISLVETRKMIETAKILGVSVPTVSFHIKSLEEEYGVKFFKTNAGGYMLTEAGEIF